MLFSIVHAVAAITLQANQVVSGLALTMLGLGVSGLVGKPYVGKPLAVKMNSWPIPFLSDIPFVGPVLFDQSPFFYMAVVLAVGAWFLFHFTTMGIRIRSVGENPRATETHGINVSAIRYWCVIIGGGFSGMAGSASLHVLQQIVDRGHDRRQGMDRHRPDHLRSLEPPCEPWWAPFCSAAFSSFNTFFNPLVFHQISWPCCPIWERCWCCCSSASGTADG